MKNKIFIALLFGMMGCVDFYVQASQLELSNGQMIRYNEAEQRYEQRKYEIRSQYDMSSSAFNRIKSILESGDFSEKQVDEIVAAYRRSVTVDIDLDARNSWIEGGGCLITSGFFSNFFKDLEHIIRASYVQFLVDPCLENVLQIIYVYKFLDNDSYKLPENFYDIIGQMGDDEIESVCRSLKEICKIQKELLERIKLNTSCDLTELITRASKTDKVLQRMRKFLVKKYPIYA